MFENNVCDKHEGFVCTLRLNLISLLRFYFMFCLHTEFVLVVCKCTRNGSEFTAWSLKSWYAYCIPVCYASVCFH